MNKNINIGVIGSSSKIKVYLIKNNNIRVKTKLSWFKPTSIYHK